jgi:hypothetical protein
MAESNYAKAYDEFAALAERGDERAMLTLGEYFHKGRGFKQDYGKAMEWYLKALEKGNADAYNNIGVLYRDGLGVPQNLEVAYALLASAVDRARNDETMGRAKRNLERADMYMTTDQANAARKLLASGITVQTIQDLKRKAVASPAGWDERAVSSSLLAALPATYRADRKSAVESAARVTVERVCDDNSTEFPGGMGFTTSPVKDTKGIVKGGIYRCEAGRFSVAVPSLSSGKITIRRASRNDGRDHEAKFYEGEPNDLAPWENARGTWHAVVITMQLPSDWKGRDKDVFRRLTEMQANFTSALHTNQYRTAMVEGPQGNLLQTVVLNRIPSAIYPQTEVKMRPIREGLLTIGINRLLFQDGVIIELGMIVGKPKGVKDADFVNYALNQMDLFTGGFDLLAKGT